MKKILTLGMLGTVLLLGGCASQVYKAESFSKPQKFAIVQVTGTTSGFGLSEEEEVKLLSSLEKVLYKEFKHTRRFKLIPPSRLKRSRSYRALKGESTDGLMTMKTASGYKKFDYNEKSEAMRKLRKELKLTGTVSVMASFSKSDSSVYLSGFLPVPVPVSAGTTHGLVGLNIVAMDDKDQVIWQDFIQKETEEGVGNIMGISNFGKLYPHLIDTVQLAAREAITNLEKNVK
jgi:hypothetical protein